MLTNCMNTFTCVDFYVCRLRQNMINEKYKMVYSVYFLTYKICTLNKCQSTCIITRTLWIFQR